MLLTTMSQDEFAYDVRAIIQAFYPKEDIKVFAKEKALEYKSNSDYLADKEIDIIYLRQRIDIIISNKEEVLLQEHIDTGIIKAIEQEEIKPGLNLSIEERKSYKNHLKRLLYKMLSQLSERTLPWGTLTGIRPTKIPMKLLEEGGNLDTIQEYMENEYLCSKEKALLTLEIAQREYKILSDIDYSNGYSIYIGIPFCPTTCLYCSFTSYSIESYKDYVEDYLDALEKEIDYVSNSARGKRLTTIYVGGGTPTTLTASQLDRLLKKIFQSFPMEEVKEFTVEAGRPDSITYEKLTVLYENGVTRISINPQTMNQATLDVIGRRHTIEQIIQAYGMAREVGHRNINMDLILGLPGENIEDIRNTLVEINKLKPDSLTIHTLAVKRAARLNAMKKKYEDIEAQNVSYMLKITEEYTKKAGYKPYYLYRQKNMCDNLENIGYSIRGKEGIYNILIMEEKHTIIAIGAGASSKFVFDSGNIIERSENVKSVKDYILRVDDMIDRKRSLLERNFS